MALNNPNFKFFGKCKGCKRTRFIVRRHKVVLPIGGVAKSQDLMCKSCATNVQNAVNQGVAK